MAAISGSSANQLLKHIDYKLIKDNPKIFCILSDIAELNSAIYAKTGLTTYYGPHFTMLGSSLFFRDMLFNLQETFFSDQPIELKPAEFYSDSHWDTQRILNSAETSIVAIQSL